MWSIYHLDLPISTKKKKFHVNEWIEFAKLKTIKW